MPKPLVYLSKRTSFDKEMSHVYNYKYLCMHSSLSVGIGCFGNICLHLDTYIIVVIVHTFTSILTFRYPPSR